MGCIFDMKTFLLRLVKRLVIVTIFWGRILPTKKYNVLIVGNYEHLSACQNELIANLRHENIDYIFLYNVEKIKYLQKVISYIKCSYYIAKSRNILVYDYCFPLYCLKKDHAQKVYQLWHANGSFKKFGMPNFYKKYGNTYAEKLYSIVPVHSNYDYIFVSNQKCIEHYMIAFNDFDKSKYIVSNNIFLDLLLSENEKYIKKNRNTISIILAPTYNYNPEQNIYEQFMEHISREAIKKNINVECKMLLHPKLTANDNKIYTMLNSDILITDYSSVCFEASGINKKVAFLRSNEKTDVFTEVAQKIYLNPKELAMDILENNIVDNCLNEYITIVGNRQLDKVMELIKNNMKKV